MLEQLVNKKIMGLLEYEYEKDPDGFLGNIQKMVQTPSNTDTMPFLIEQSVLSTVLLDSKYGWVDSDKAFDFLVSKGYDFSTQFKTVNRKSSVSEYSSKKNSELGSCILLLNDKNNRDLEPLIAKFIMDKGPEKILNMFKEEGFDFYRYVEEKNLTELAKVMPKLSNYEKGENLLKVFTLSNNGVINVDSFSDLDEKSREYFINGVKASIDKSLLLTEIGPRTNGSVDKIKNVLSILKKELTDHEKSDFLRWIPQKTYYREISNALGLRFSSKDFVGTPWDRLIDIAINNSKYYSDKDKYKKITFKIENAWNKWIIESRNKFEDVDNHNGGNIVMAFASLYRDIYAPSEFFKSPQSVSSRSNVREGSGFNLNFINAQFYHDPRMIDFVVNEFYNNKFFRNNFEDFEIISEYQKEIFPRINKELLIDATFSFEGDYFVSSILGKLSLLEKSDIQVSDYVANLDNEMQSSLAKKIYTSHNENNKEVSNGYLLSIVNALRSENFEHLFDGPNDPSSETIHKIYQNVLLDRNLNKIKVDNDDDVNSSGITFKL